MGKNFKKALALSTVKTFPKFELAAIFTYFTILAEFRRPSMTTSTNVSKLFSSITISADSLATSTARSEEHTSELQSHSDLVCRLLLEKKKNCTRRLTDTGTWSVRVVLM